MTHVNQGIANAALGAVAAKPVRAVHTFDVPASVGAPFSSIGLHELETGEELMAARRSGGDAMSLAYELVKASIAEVTDAGASAPREVSLADASTDTVFRVAGPKLRQLLLQAYSSLHTPGDDATADFLKSHRTTVG